MKNIKCNLFYCLASFLLLLSISSCDDFLDLQPTKDSTAEQLLMDEAGVQGMTNGALGMMKDQLGDSPNNVYNRLLFQTLEFPSDNVLIIGPTTDALWLDFNLAHTTTQVNMAYLWATGYKMILNANNVINNAEITDATPDTYKHLVGENYFYRGITFFDLAKIFSYPPSQGLDNMGILLKTRLDHEDAQARATVGETYKQIIDDLEMAADLMTERASNPTYYGNKYAAKGYLTRAYLFNLDYDKVITTADDVIMNSGFVLSTTANYVQSMQNTPSSTEAMFILYHAEGDDKGTGAIGSMFNGDKGWGEIFPSEPLYNMFRDNPEDVRNDLIKTNSGVLKNNYEERFVTKFSYQEPNMPTLHSPMYMRLSEVYLNRAEAYANTPGQEQKALDDVNAIRTARGYTGAKLYTMANYASFGFATVLEAVLHERRLELAFEGHRRTDLMRNKIDMNRNYKSAQNETGVDDILEWNAPRQIFYIPLGGEINYNPLLIQND